MSILLTLIYKSDRWRPRGSHLYQIVAQLLDTRHLLIAELISCTDAGKPTIEHIGVYTSRAEGDGKDWELAYEIPPLAFTLVAGADETGGFEEPLML